MMPDITRQLESTLQEQRDTLRLSPEQLQRKYAQRDMAHGLQRMARQWRSQPATVGRVSPAEQTTSQNQSG